jgi:hypothetical protein
VRPTRVSTLVALLLGVGALAWGGLRIAEQRGSSLPELTWTAPTGIAILALVVVVTTVALRSRLRGDRRPDPLGVARMAVLGKASAHVGPIVGGCYLGYLVVLLPGLEIASRQDRAVISAVALVASVVLAAAGLWLERTCRVRGGDPDLLDEPDLLDPFD